MKLGMPNSTAVVFCVVIFSLATFGTPSPALATSILIRVDVSNPAAVTFSATGEAPLINDSSSITNDGVTLGLFFAPSATGLGSTAASGSLMAAGTTVAYDRMTNAAASLTDRDLNIFSITSPFPTQNFSVGSAAFSGVLTHNLSAQPLPQPGRSGDIYAGFDPSTDPVIGQWAAVPEPTTALLLASGLAGLAATGRRRSLH